MNASSSAASAIEQQIWLLQRLADSLTNAQEALLKSDLPGLKESTALQTDICEQVRYLRQPSGASCASEANPRWHEFSSKLIEAEQRVRQLNRVYGVLLRRAARSVRVTQNLLRMVNGTYERLDCAGPSLSESRSR